MHWKFGSNVTCHVKNNRGYSCYRSAILKGKRKSFQYFL